MHALKTIHLKKKTNNTWYSVGPQKAFNNRLLHTNQQTRPRFQGGRFPGGREAAVQAVAAQSPGQKNVPSSSGSEKIHFGSH